MKQPSILWHSNSPWAPTGYGQQVRLFCEPLAEHYNLAISAFYGLEGSRLTYHGIPIFPGLGGEFGNAYLLQHLIHWFEGSPKEGLLLTLLDVWVLDPQMVAQTNAASWVPVDHNPMPPRVENFFLQSGAIPIAMSRFGEEQLADLDPLYVPHGVDVDSYRPRPMKDCDKLREVLGIDKNAFVVGMVAANKGRPSRKGFQQAFEAFRHFREKNENAILYLHTSRDPNYAQGENLEGLIQALGIPMDAIHWGDQWRMHFDPYPQDAMSLVYSMFDVLINPAQGEGFGVPILEAQACGTPVIVTDFSAMPEVGKVGWQVGWSPNWTAQDSWQATAFVPDIVGALEECQSLPAEKRAKLAKKARQHAMNYAAPKVMEKHFLPALEKVCERVGLSEKPKLEVAA